MIFCLLIEIIMFSFIVIDLVKLITNKRNHSINYFEMILVGLFFLLFIYAYLAGKEHEILLWMNKNNMFYLVFLLSTLIKCVLDIILYHRK